MDNHEFLEKRLEEFANERWQPGPAYKVEARTLMHASLWNDDEDNATPLFGWGDVVVEGGAGCGALTRELYNIGCKVIAYEPHPELFAGLEVQAREWPRTEGQVEVRNLALDWGSGPIQMRLDAEPWNSNVAELQNKAAWLQTKNIVEVGATNIVDAIKEVDATALLLDVEGYEFQLLPAVMDGWEKTSPALGDHLGIIVLEWHQHLRPASESIACERLLRKCRWYEKLRIPSWNWKEGALSGGQWRVYSHWR